MRNQVVVVGGGMMGYGIAAAAMAAGEKVTIVVKPGHCKRTVLLRVQELLDELHRNNLILQRGTKDASDALCVSDNLEESCSNASLVIEAVTENLSLKKELFSQLDSLLPEDVVIASNTSGLRITDISAKSVHRHRMLTTHFWFPAHIVPLVEIVLGEGSSLELAERVRDRLQSWQKAPVVVKRDLPGQLANRILQAVIREASAIVEMGLATPEDVDTAVKMGMGIRFPVWGPLEHVDAVGLDLCNSVQNSVLPSISRETQANDAFGQRLTQGDLGYKSGKGFYDWSKKDMEALVRLRNDFIIQAVRFIREQG